MRTRFNKNIESYRSERFDLDKEAMWTEIDLRINKRSKRRPFFFGLCLALMLSSVSFLLQRAESKNISEIHEPLSSGFTHIERVDHSTLEKDNEVEIHSDPKKLPLAESSNDVNNFKKGNSLKNNFIAVDDTQESLVDSEESSEQNLEVVTKIQKDKRAIAHIETDSYYLSYHRKKVNIASQSHAILPHQKREKFQHQMGVSFELGTFLFENNIDVTAGTDLLFINNMNTYLSPMFGFSAGVKVDYQIAKRIALSTGLNIVQINERFEFYSDTLINIFQQTAQGSVAILDKIERQVAHTNHLRFIEIPICVSYEEGLGLNKMRFNLGLSYSHMYDYNGRMLNESSQVQSYTGFKEVKNIYRQDNLKLNIGAAYMIPLYDQWDLSISYTHSRDLMDNIIFVGGSRKFVLNEFKIGINYSFYK